MEDLFLGFRPLEPDLERHFTNETEQFILQVTEPILPNER